MPIKLLAASRRRPGLTRADYQRYLEFVHGTIARRERLKIASYVQNHVIDGAFGVLDDDTHQQLAERDAVVELSFDSFRDMLSTLEPAEPSAASVDGKFFADERNNIIVMVEEEEIPVPTPMATYNPGLGLVEGVGALKVLQYIMRDESVYPEDYLKYWREAHEEALEKVPYAREQLRRCVLNKRCRANDNDAAARKHFKMVNPPVYDAVAFHWYDTIEQAGAFRQYNEALKSYSKKKFANWSKSFFLYTKEIVVVRDTPKA
ncbi:EthD domain-containing protein [Oleisolibacter albus]|uniref:EthD domain-containing protein n=1 Tax=Oleisolibacter albus TaxID=2171757 RepID=UPI000DF2E6D9|nr:EthD domain-containing protein [Oleisolibacter albus]